MTLNPVTMNLQALNPEAVNPTLPILILAPPFCPQMLKRAGIRVAAYHAGRQMEERLSVQRDFSLGLLRVVVATVRESGQKGSTHVWVFTHDMGAGGGW